MSSEYLVVFNFIRVVAALPAPVRGVPGNEAVILRLVDKGDLPTGHGRAVLRRHQPLEAHRGRGAT